MKIKREKRTACFDDSFLFCLSENYYAMHICGAHSPGHCHVAGIYGVSNHVFVCHHQQILPTNIQKNSDCEFITLLFIYKTLINYKLHKEDATVMCDVRLGRRFSFIVCSACVPSLSCNGKAQLEAALIPNRYQHNVHRALLQWNMNLQISISNRMQKEIIQNKCPQSLVIFFSFSFLICWCWLAGSGTEMQRCNIPHSTWPSEFDDECMWNSCIFKA